MKIVSRIIIVCPKLILGLYDNNGENPKNI